MENSFEIGLRLKKLRRGLHQEIYAKRLGISYRAYQNYEAGKRIPPARILEKIAEKGSVSVDWILRGDKKCFDAKDISDKIQVLLMKEGGEKLKKILENRLYEIGISPPHNMDGFIDTVTYLMRRGKFEEFLKLLILDDSSLEYLVKKQIERIFEEGSDKKIHAIQSLLGALDPGEHKV